MSRYAENTSVASDKSRAEIEKTLARYGADQFLYGWNQQGAVVGFVAHGRQIRFTLPLPDRDDDEFRLTPSRKWERSEKDQEAAYEQAVRQRWRALALVIKAKLEAVETWITTFEDEFLAHTMLPTGETVADWIQPQLRDTYAGGGMPALLPESRPALEAAR